MERDPTDIVQQEREEAEGEAKRQRQQAQGDADLLAVMDSERGRRVIWRLLEKTGFYNLSFTGSDAHTNFNEGSRNVGLALFAQLHRVCPLLYGKMAAENWTDGTGIAAEQRT